MAEAVKMPRMSDTMTEGVIVEWHKKIGDKIKPGDLLAEVETDKATMELESYNTGTILYIGVEKGKAAAVDSILFIVGKDGEDYKELLNGGVQKVENANQNTEGAKPKAESKEQEIKKDKQETVSLPIGAKEIRMPLLSDTMTEGKIISWNKKLGDFVKSDDVLAEVETDKATMEVVGYEEGTLLYVGVEAGNAAKINEIIAIVGKAGTDVSAYVAAEKRGANNKADGGKQKAESATADTLNPQLSALSTNQESSNDRRIKASPLAKKLAADKGIDIAKITGSGDGGRIVKSDIDNYKEESGKQKAESNKPSSVSPQPLVFSGIEGYTDTANTQMRKTIARRLGESMFTAPHFYLTMEINMDNAMEMRSKMNEVSPVKISFNDMLIKACAMALRQHPSVNSSWMGDFIRTYNHIHIGSAVAMPNGLIVPVIRFADQKSFSQIAADAKELYAKAKDNKLQPAEFSGNTFTISNLGMMDIEEFTAIINPPDSCILAVGKIKEIVIKKDGAFTTTNVMKVTLSCDHRSVDGAVGAGFLQTVKKLMESPLGMVV